VIFVVDAPGMKCDDLPGDGADLFKAFKRELECFFFEGDCSPKRSLDVLFDIVAMPCVLMQHGED
jgi:hypothetical protein